MDAVVGAVHISAGEDDSAADDALELVNAAAVFFAEGEGVEHDLGSKRADLVEVRGEVGDVVVEVVSREGEVRVMLPAVVDEQLMAGGGEFASGVQADEASAAKDEDAHDPDIILLGLTG